VLRMFCDRDLEIKSMTLKLEDHLDIPKTYPNTKNEAAASLRHSKRRALIEQIRIYVAKSRSKCHKLRITSSVIVTDVLIKPRQFLTGSF